MSFGPAASGRRIVCTVASVAAAVRTLTSATIGGISATVVMNVGAALGGAASAIIIADVPTGTSGDVALTFDGTVLRSVVNLWSVTDLNSATASDTASDNGATANAFTTTIDVPAGGFAVACVNSNDSSSSWTWTNLTEVDDRTTESNFFGAAGEAFVSAQTGLAITATGAGSTTRGTLAVASWGN
jgi:hypothetical protein